MKKHLILFLCLNWILMPGILWAQEVNEEDLFSDGKTVIEVEEQPAAKVSEAVTQESVTFSGDISAVFEYNITRDCLEGDDDWGDNPYDTSVEGDFLLDTRLRKEIKAFANLGAVYSPQEDEDDPETEHLQSTLKEFFVGVNISRKIYFWFGKQTLIWGRGYLWNPTDLISEDRKDFIDVDARREGVYGLKMHIPFGTTWNLYGFINTSGANTTEEFALVGKVEVLLPKDIEMAVSAWTKKHYRSVFGVDFAARKFRIDWRGEISLSYGDNRHRLECNNGTYIDTLITDQWVPRLSLGFTKTFDYGDIKERIQVIGEFYYNHGGYGEDMLTNEATREQFLEGDYFESGNYGKYYAAVFSSVDKFLVTDMTLELKTIGNLSDSSWIVSSGVEYELANNATLSFKLDGYVGSKNREYTLEGKSMSAEIAVELVF